MTMQAPGLHAHEACSLVLRGPLVITVPYTLLASVIPTSHIGMRRDRERTLLLLNE